MAFLTMADSAASFNDSVYVEETLRRIAARVTHTVNGCHECSLSLNDLGYSTISFGGRMWRTHRLLWFIKRGEIPAHLVLDHLCRNPKCCNLDHLEVVTNAENTLRGNRRYAGGRKPQTHCQRGHLFDGYMRGGKRECRICSRETARRYLANLSPDKLAARRDNNREIMRRRRASTPQP